MPRRLAPEDGDQSLSYDYHLLTDGIGRGQNRSSGVERGLNASLGDRDGLLFHGFVNGDLIFNVHFVELVDATDAVVGQHESAGFNNKLVRLLVTNDGRRQTSGGRRLAGSVDGSVECRRGGSNKCS